VPPQCDGCNSRAMALCNGCYKALGSQERLGETLARDREDELKQTAQACSDKQCCQLLSDIGFLKEDIQPLQESQLELQCNVTIIGARLDTQDIVVERLVEQVGVLERNLEGVMQLDFVAEPLTDESQRSQCPRFIPQIIFTIKGIWRMNSSL